MMIEQQKIVRKTSNEFDDHKVTQFLNICQVDRNQALFYLKTNSFDLQNAILAYYDDPNLASKHLRKKQLQQKYNAFVRKKMSNKRSYLGDYVQKRTHQFVNEIKELWKQLIPDSIRGRSPGQDFIKEIGQKLKNITFEKQNFYEAIRQSSLAKPVLVFIYSLKNYNLFIQNFTPELCTTINSHYHCIGLLKKSKDFQENFGECLSNIESSGLAVFRVSFCEEITLVNSINLGDSIKSTQISAFIKQSELLVHQQILMQKSVLRQIQLTDENLSSDLQIEYNGLELIQPEEDMQDISSSSYIQDKEIKIQQEKQFLQSKLIHQRELKKKEEQEMLEKLQKQELQSLRQERMFRKKSIPDQPTHQNVVTFAFRLPKGGRIFRKFDANQKIQLIFSFIELNEQVQFEDELKRQFDLLTISPTISLLTKKNELIRQVFEQSQETLLVKEL